MMVTQRLLKILRGSNIAAKSALESAVKAALQNAGGAMYVPFTLTMDGSGNVTGTTTATFSEVAAAVAAKRNVVALVDVMGSMMIKAPVSAFSPVTGTPTNIVFSVVNKSAGDAGKPTLYQIHYTESDIGVDNIELT